MSGGQPELAESSAGSGTTPVASSNMDIILSENNAAIDAGINPSALENTGSKNENPGSTKLEGDFLREALLKQVEYYFSRQNLSQDAYLVSQMNSDLYVPVATILSFKMIKALTDDISLLKSVMRQSKHVVVDPTGSMVRPNFQNKRATVIIRDISSAANPEEIKGIFEGDLASKIKGIRSDIGDTWFVQFDDEEDALSALELCRSRTFRGLAVKARIKSENLLRNFYLPGMDGSGTPATTAGGPFPSKVFSHGPASQVPLYPGAPVWGRPANPYASYGPPNADPAYRMPEAPPYGGGAAVNPYPYAPNVKPPAKLNPAAFPINHTPSPRPPTFTGPIRKYTRDDLLQVFRALSILAMPRSLVQCNCAVVLSTPALQLECTKSWPHVDEGEEDGDAHSYEADRVRRNSRSRTSSYSESRPQHHHVRHDSTDRSQPQNLRPSPQPQPHQPRHHKLPDAASAQPCQDKVQSAVQLHKERGLNKDTAVASRADKPPQQSEQLAPPDTLCVAAACAGVDKTESRTGVEASAGAQDMAGTCSVAAAASAGTASASLTPSATPWAWAARKPHHASPPHTALPPTHAPQRAPQVASAANAAPGRQGYQAAAPASSSPHPTDRAAASHRAVAISAAAGGTSAARVSHPPPGASAAGSPAAPAPANLSASAPARRAWGSASASPPVSRPQAQQQPSSPGQQPHPPPPPTAASSVPPSASAFASADGKRTSVDMDSQRDACQQHNAPPSAPHSDASSQTVTPAPVSTQSTKGASEGPKWADMDAPERAGAQASAAAGAASTSRTAAGADVARKTARTYADAAKTFTAPPPVPVAAAAPAPAPAASKDARAPRHQAGGRGGGAGTSGVWKREADRHMGREKAHWHEGTAAPDAQQSQPHGGSAGAPAITPDNQPQSHPHASINHGRGKTKGQLRGVEQGSGRKGGGGANGSRTSNGKARTKHQQKAPRKQGPVPPHPPTHASNPFPPPIPQQQAPQPSPLPPSA